MKKLLIVDASAVLAEALIAILPPQFDIRICTDGDRAAEVLNTFRPELLVINTHLPGADGLTLLRQAVHTPDHIVALTLTPTAYVCQVLAEVGVDLILQIPCAPRVLAGHLESMAKLCRFPKLPAGPAQIVSRHLEILGFPSTKGGYQQLYYSLLLFAQDPYQSLSKELQPMVAQMCGDTTGSQVESKSRRLIGEVWEGRNRSIWQEYFPEFTERPKFRQFLCAFVCKLGLTTEPVCAAQNE